MKITKRVICALLALVMTAACLTACGGGAKTPNTKTSSYDDMVAYLTDKGYIAKDAAPVDINTSEGYVQDNTGGQMAVCEVADKAQDLGGLWLFWFDADNNSELYQSNFANIAMNGGTIVIMGGAAILNTAAYSGNFAIAFAEDYAQKDAVLADFNALPKA